MRVELPELSEDDEWFVRCVLIARGGAKALAVASEAKRLTAAMRHLLEACDGCEEILEADKRARLALLREEITEMESAPGL